MSRKERVVVRDWRMRTISLKSGELIRIEVGHNIAVELRAESDTYLTGEAFCHDDEGPFREVQIEVEYYRRTMPEPPPLEAR
jgi:hypothetical protein